jgi:hypothetical protein
MEEALARKERLKALKQAAELAQGPPQESEEAQPAPEKPVLKFRNYAPRDEKIEHEKVWRAFVHSICRSDNSPSVAPGCARSAPQVRGARRGGQRRVVCSSGKAGGWFCRSTSASSPFLLLGRPSSQHYECLVLPSTHMLCAWLCCVSATKHMCTALGRHSCSRNAVGLSMCTHSYCMQEYT